MFVSKLFLFSCLFTCFVNCVKKRPITHPPTIRFPRIVLSKLTNSVQFQEYLDANSSELPMKYQSKNMQIYQNGNDERISEKETAERTREIHELHAKHELLGFLSNVGEPTVPPATPSLTTL